MSERSGAHEQSEQCGASKQVSGASEQTNGQASGPVLTSGFLAVMNHCESIISNFDKLALFHEKIALPVSRFSKLFYRISSADC